MGALTSQQIKDFRNQPVIKSFYKFIETYNLRSQALALLNEDLDDIDLPLKSDEATYEDVEAIV